MNHWMRVTQVMQEEDLEPGEPGNTNDLLPSDQSPLEPETSNLPNPPIGIESPFGEGSALAGKSTAEIEAEVALLNTTVREQGRRLSEQHSQIQAAPSAPDEGGVNPTPDITSTQFFENPAEAVTKIVETVVSKHLAESIAPFADSLVVDQTTAAWAEAAAQYPDITNRRVLIQAKLDEGGVSAPKFETIIFLYKVVLGDLALSNQLPNQ